MYLIEACSHMDHTSPPSEGASRAVLGVLEADDRLLHRDGRHRELLLPHHLLGRTTGSWEMAAAAWEEELPKKDYQP